MLGGSQFHGGEKKGRWGQLHLAHPSGTVLPHKKELRADGGERDVDYKGGASCRRADVRVCGGARETR